MAKKERKIYSTEEIFEIFKKHRKICIDSRNIVPDSIFFAIKGKKYDGNKFCEEALEKSCAYCVIDNPRYQKDERCLLVEDCLKTLQELARLYRRELFIPLIGITGTNGKTTTKELIKSVLSVRYKTFATEGNLNNEIGVPLSVLSIPPSCQVAVIEMGASHLGDIETLCRICLPTYGLITNIGSAHLEGFGSQENLLKTKKELYDFLMRTSGKVFVNAKERKLCEILGDYPQKFLYGNDSRLYTHVEIMDTDGIYVNAKLLGLASAPNITEMSSKLVGKYNVDNIAAAACIGRYFGLSDKEIKKGIESYEPQNMRSQLVQKSENVLISDTYNANPSSMMAAIESFISLKTPNTKAFILGDMLEMGEKSLEEHQKIVDFLVSRIEKERENECVYLVGDMFSKTINKPKTFKVFKNANKLCEHLEKEPIKQSCLLVKASRGIGLEKVIDIL